MRWRVIAVGLFVSLVGASEARSQDAKLIQQGEKIVADQKCSVCHSIGGKGNQKGPLDDVGSRLSAEEIRQWLINPRVMTEKTKSARKPVMPAYTKLSADELKAIVAYMQSLKKK